MVELMHDTLVFAFPDVHPDARLRMTFQRTLRIPDNGKTYPLPPALGSFPLRHVDDFAATVPPSWSTHGGVMLPMYQSEALWLWFRSDRIAGRGVPYPCAIKIAAGKIDAVSGGAWTNDLCARPQNYVVAPSQPWLDGFAVSAGVIRQFVAMPLGSGYSAEEQITGRGEHGGLQILVRPMKRDEFDRRFRRAAIGASFDIGAPLARLEASPASMALAPGGRMKQEIYEDPYGIDVWDAGHSRCYVHLVNSLMWEAITDAKPPSPPMTARVYAEHQLPWFDYYGEGETALNGSETLARLKSIIEMARQKGDVPLPENDDIAPAPVVPIRPRGQNKVREGAF